MTTTIQIGEKNKEVLESLIEEHDLRSKDDAVSHLTTRAEEAGEQQEIVRRLKAEKAELESQLENIPPSHKQYPQVYEMFDLAWSLPIPKQLTQIVVEQTDTLRLFSLIERSTPYMSNPASVGKTPVLSVYRVATTELYLLVYHRLANESEPRACFAIDSTYYEKEILNLLRAGEWVAPQGGVPKKVSIDGVPEPTFGSIGRPVAKSECDKLFELPSIAAALRGEDVTDKKEVLQAFSEL